MNEHRDIPYKPPYSETQDKDIPIKNTYASALWAKHGFYSRLRGPPRKRSASNGGKTTDRLRVWGLVFLKDLGWFTLSQLGLSQTRFLVRVVGFGMV